MGGRLQMVGVIGFEPTTSWSQTRRASQLRYTPMNSALASAPIPTESEKTIGEDLHKVNKTMLH